MRRLAATTALLLLLAAACSTEDTSTPAPSAPTSSATDPSPRAEAIDALRANVPEWADYSIDQIVTASEAVCARLDAKPDDVASAVSDVQIELLDSSVDRTLQEYRTAAGSAVVYAANWDCQQHREAVNQWAQIDPE